MTVRNYGSHLSIPWARNTLRSGHLPGSGKLSISTVVGFTHLALGDAVQPEVREVSIAVSL